MDHKPSIFIRLLPLICWAAVGLAYLLWGREWLSLEITQPQSALLHYASVFYPRLPAFLAAEGEAALLRLADQLMLRLGLLSGLWWWVWAVGAGFWQRLAADHAISAPLLKVYRYGFYLAVLLTSWRSYWELTALRPFQVWAAPFGWYRWLPLIPAGGWLEALVLAQWAMAALAMLRGQAWAGWGFALLYLYLEGLQFCFQGIGHHLAIFGHVALLLPWLMWLQSTKNPPAAKAAGLMLRAAIVLPYTLAGLEKLLFSGWQWTLPAAFVHLLVADHAYLSALLAWLVLAFQLGFVLVLWDRRWCWLFLPAGVTFHVLVYALTGIGGWIHPWWLSYFLLVDWVEIGKRVFHLSAGGLSN